MRLTNSENSEKGFKNGAGVVVQKKCQISNWPQQDWLKFLELDKCKKMKIPKHGNCLVKSNNKAGVQYANWIWSICQHNVFN